jgi:alpha-N-arabinofuranosidase
VPAQNRPARAANPVLPGFHPDPSICRVGDDYYLACSSFEYFPGIPIFRSRDLVRWTQLGHVLTRRSQLELAGVRSSGGIYAPTLRYHEGTFYVVTTHVERGNFFVAAPRAGGPWSDPVWLDEEGVDPSLAFLDGRVYYTRNGRGTDPDHPFIFQSELVRTPHGLTQKSEPQVIWKGTGGIWPEGPHLYRRGEWYYLVTAEGGTSYGHSVVVARSRTPHGPFVASPHGPLLTHRERPRHPIQATGHADLVELEDGSTWAVLLGVRPTRGRHHHLGREAFLAPVCWDVDGWPRIPRLELRMAAPPLRTVGSTASSDTVEFASARLPASFVFVRNPVRGSWSLRERPGFLRLWGLPASLRDVASPAFACRRQQHHEMTARTRLTFDPRRPNEQAGLCLRANELFHASLVVTVGERARELRLVRTSAGRATTLGSTKLGRGPVTLEVRATAAEYVFAGGTGQRLQDLGRVATRAFSAEAILRRTGRHHFTGTMVGLLATGNGSRASAPADFHWFAYEA